jgi:hypothetical protein
VLALATARTTRRTILGGVLLGLAIATKLTPALTVPALLRRRWLTVCVAAGSAFVAVYIPHVLAVGGKVIGFLPGYLQQEGYTGGTRFGIIGLFVTGWLAMAVAALIMGAVAFAVLQFGDPDRPWEGAVYVTATALAVATPHYQWYSLLLVMLVALDGRPEWLAFAAGAYYAAEPSIGRYTVPYHFHDAFAYGVPILVVAGGWLLRHDLARRGLVPVRVGSAPVGSAAVGSAPVGSAPVGSAPVGLAAVSSAAVGLASGGLAPAGLAPVGSAAGGLAAVSSAAAGLASVGVAPADWAVLAGSAATSGAATRAFVTSGAQALEEPDASLDTFDAFSPRLARRSSPSPS